MITRFYALINTLHRPYKIPDHKTTVFAALSELEIFRHG